MNEKLSLNCAAKFHRCFQFHESNYKLAICVPEKLSYLLNALKNFFSLKKELIMHQNKLSCHITSVITVTQEGANECKCKYRPTNIVCVIFLATRSFAAQ